MVDLKTRNIPAHAECIAFIFAIEVLYFWGILNLVTQGDKELSLLILMIHSCEIWCGYWQKCVIPLNKIWYNFNRILHLLRAILKWKGLQKGQSPAVSSTFLSAAQLSNIFTWLFHTCVCCCCSKLSKKEGTIQQNCFYSESGLQLPMEAFIQ